MLLALFVSISEVGTERNKTDLVLCGPDVYSWHCKPLDSYLHDQPNVIVYVYPPERKDPPKTVAPSVLASPSVPLQPQKDQANDRSSTGYPRKR